MKFQKGNAGRPVGSKNKRLALLQSSDVRLQEKLLEMALAGDVGALRIVADRLWPRLRAEAALVNVQTNSSDLAEQGRQIINAGLSGEISADVLRDLLTSLYAQGKIVELAEFEERLRQLEGHHIAQPWESQKPKMRLIAETEILPMRGNKKRKLK